MAAPDPGYVRGYRAEVDRHRKNAERAAEYIAEKIASIRRGNNPRLALGDARNLASDLSELTAALAALSALADVEFLATDPDAEEV